MKQHYRKTSLGTHDSYIFERLYECNTAMVMFKPVACQVSLNSEHDSQVKSELDDLSCKTFL